VKGNYGRMSPKGNEGGFIEEESFNNNLGVDVLTIMDEVNLPASGRLGGPIGRQIKRNDVRVLGG